MPVHPEKGGYQWGSHGKIYKGRGAKQKAQRQGAAAYAAGYREPGKGFGARLRPKKSY